jgi:hypothetical protein
METFTTKDGTIITYNNGNVDIQKKESDMPAIGSKYWYVDGCLHKYSVTWKDDELDNCHYKAGNYFLTEAACDAKIEYDIALAIVRRAIKKLNGDWKPDWRDNDEEKFVIIYNYAEHSFTSNFNYYLVKMTPLPVMRTKEIADQIIANYEKELCIIRDYQF